MTVGAVTVGFALCGSFCTLSRALPQMQALLDAGYEVLPIMSFNAGSIDTRFGKAADFIEKIEAMCGRKVIRSILEAEPIGPKKMTDIMLIAPCTGNTLAKLANGITDTPVTMAAKSHLRARVRCFAVATNDARSARRHRTSAGFSIGSTTILSRSPRMILRKSRPPLWRTSISLSRPWRRRSQESSSSLFSGARSKIICAENKIWLSLRSGPSVCSLEDKQTALLRWSRAPL